MILPVQSRPFTDDLIVIGGRAVLFGWSAYTETTANVFLRDGLNTSGQLRGISVLDATVDTPSGADFQWFGPNGVLMEQGIFVECSAAIGGGVVYYAPETLYPPSVLSQFSGSQRKLTPYVGQDDANELMGLE